MGDIFWNENKIFTVIPCDYKVNNQVLYVDISAGPNSLRLQGAGISDGYGLTIDNVKLIRDGDKTNIVINGDFEEVLSRRNAKIFSNINGWQGDKFKIGRGTIFNFDWTTNNVVELDGRRKNTHLAQNWMFDSNYNLVQSRIFKLSLNYACK